MAPQKYQEKWIPGLRLTAHPGMTTLGCIAPLSASCR
jgi:hypothetical protein